MVVVIPWNDTTLTKLFSPKEIVCDHEHNNEQGAAPHRRFIYIRCNSYILTACIARCGCVDYDTQVAGLPRRYQTVINESRVLPALTQLIRVSS